MNKQHLGLSVALNLKQCSYITSLCRRPGFQAQSFINFVLERKFPLPVFNLEKCFKIDVSCLYELMLLRHSTGDVGLLTQKVEGISSGLSCCILC